MIVRRTLPSSCALFLALSACGDPSTSSNEATGPNDSSSGSSTSGGSTALASGGSGGSASGEGGEPFGSGGFEPSSGGTAAGGSDTTGSGGDSGAGATGGVSTGGNPSVTTDVFGITMLKASKAGGDEWNSLHWYEGSARSFTGRDPSDPSGYSIRRGNGNLMEIDGDGVLSMGGEQPRLYVQPESDEERPFFRDVEFTGYYRRTANDGASNAGFAVGIRAHVNGHGNVDHCLASTYYLIFRNSGTWLFDKELNHPTDSPGESGQLFNVPGPIPVGQWIGMKFLAYNLPGDTSVKLEAYLDAETNGDVSEGGSWTKIAEVVDDGDWSAPVGDCGFPSNTVITQGGGVVFIRNTAVTEVQYKNISWREIVDAPATP